MKKMLEVTKKDLLLIWKDKVALIWMVAIPVLLIATIGSVFNFSSSSGGFSVTVPVVNQDGANSAAFTSVLSSTGVLVLEAVSDEAHAAKRLSDTNNSAAAYIDVLHTYSNHRALTGEQREGLFACIRRLITETYGGSITKRYLYELRLARRRV